MFPSPTIMPGQGRIEIPAPTLRRSWLKKRVAVSDALSDVVVALALGNLKADAAPWPELPAFHLAEARQ